MDYKKIYESFNSDKVREILLKYMNDIHLKYIDFSYFSKFMVDLLDLSNNYGITLSEPSIKEGLLLFLKSKEDDNWIYSKLFSTVYRELISQNDNQAEADRYREALRDTYSYWISNLSHK